MSESTIFDALSEVDVVDFLQHLGVTHRAGGGDNVNIQICPACGNPNWKVRMSKTKRLGYCFYAPCEAKFNLFSFTKAVFADNSRDAMRALEGYLGPIGFKKTNLVAAVATVTPEDWSLPASIELPTPAGATHPFLTERRILPSTQSLYGLRYCHVGSYTHTDATGSYTQHYNDRIIIPVVDLDGHIKTFQGRATWRVDESLAEKRYIFPTGLPGSGRFLFGGNLCRGRKRLVLVEGPFDVMATHQAIVDHPDFRDCGVAGIFGLSLGSSAPDGDDQLGRLRRLREEGLEEVTLMLDAERNAYNKALKIGATIASAGLKVKIATLPDGADPNEVETRVVRGALDASRSLTRNTLPMLSITNPYR